MRRSSSSSPWSWTTSGACKRRQTRSFLSQHARGAETVAHDFIEIEIARVERPTLAIRDGQQKHVVDDLGQPVGLQADDVEGFAVFGLCPSVFCQRDLGSGTGDANRRPQLMRGIRHEPPLCLYRLGEPVEYRH